MVCLRRLLALAEFELALLEDLYPPDGQGSGPGPGPPAVSKRNAAPAPSVKVLPTG
jgi:hypothetical protein